MVNILRIPSPNKYSGHAEPVTLIGIHTEEAPETDGTAVAVANYFARSSTQASAHWSVDEGTRVHCVDDGDSAWAMPPTNHYSLNIEMAGYANQSLGQWNDPFSLATMDNAAVIAADWCQKFDIPVRHLTDDQIRSKEKGFAGHVDVNRVFGQSDHTDPGPNFPWEYFLGLVSKHLGIVPPKPTATPNCMALQKAVRCEADNMWGAVTDHHCDAAINATYFAGNKFPYGTKFTQAVVGSIQDGIWGPKSQAALIETIRTMQIALRGMAFNPGVSDGIWGPNTNRAYEAARNACHI